jgi:hypothetical protein
MILERIWTKNFRETSVLLFPRLKTLNKHNTQTTLGAEQEFYNDLPGAHSTIHYLFRA